MWFAAVGPSDDFRRVSDNIFVFERLVKVAVGNRLLQPLDNIGGGRIVFFCEVLAQKLGLGGDSDALGDRVANRARKRAAREALPILFNEQKTAISNIDLSKK